MKYDLLTKKRNVAQKNIELKGEKMSPKQSTIDFLLSYAAAYEAPKNEEGEKMPLGVILN